MCTGGALDVIPRVWYVGCEVFAVGVFGTSGLWHVMLQ